MIADAATVLNEQKNLFPPDPRIETSTEVCKSVVDTSPCAVYARLLKSRKPFAAIFLIVVLSLLASPTSLEAFSEHREVVVEGIGDSPQSAAKNATENALKRVLGSYVDSETVVKERYRETDNERQGTREIIRQTREYSKGVVKDVVVLDITQDSGIYRATVRVLVRINK